MWAVNLLYIWLGRWEAPWLRCGEIVVLLSWSTSTNPSIVHVRNKLWLNKRGAAHWLTSTKPHCAREKQTVTEWSVLYNNWHNETVHCACEKQTVTEQAWCCSLVDQYENALCTWETNGDWLKCGSYNWQYETALCMWETNGDWASVVLLIDWQYETTCEKQNRNGDRPIY